MYLCPALLLFAATAAASDDPTTTPTYVTPVPTTTTNLTASPTMMPPTSSPTRFIGTRKITKYMSCDSRGCSATMSIDTSDYFVESASLSLAVGGDLWTPPQHVTISVDGKERGICGWGNREFCADPMIPCLSKMDVTKAASGTLGGKGAVDITFKANRKVGDFGVLCTNYPGFPSGVAAILMAELDLELTQTAAPTPSPAPTQQFKRSISQTALCRARSNGNNGCLGKAVLDTSGYSISSASLSIEAEGDLNRPQALLYFGVNGTAVGSCGGMGSSCFLEVNPLLPCLSQIDVTDYAQTGSVVVDFESSDTVFTFCTFEGDNDLGAVVKVTIDLVLNEL